VLLSICVPTYNRCNLLVETIESIIASIKFSNVNCIEIIISDNASTDKTTETIELLKGRYPEIRSRRNEVNVIDENFFQVASIAQGEYIWIFADDDLMEVEAVKKVVECIYEKNNLIILNYSIWNQDFTELVIPLRYSRIAEIKVTDSNQVLKKFGMGLQFISSVVIKKDIFFNKNMNYNYKMLHQYGNSFLYAVYAGILNDCKTKYIENPLLKYRGFNSNLSVASKWYSYFIYGNNFLLSLLQSLGYSKQAVRCARKNIIKYYLLRDIVARKKADENTFKLIKIIPRAYYGHFYFWGIGLPIAVIPNKLFRFVYYTIKLHKKKVRYLVYIITTYIFS
jgi:glycosyltransferase involved in cell wall biosynthesis